MRNLMMSAAVAALAMSLAAPGPAAAQASKKTDAGVARSLRGSEASKNSSKTGAKKPAARTDAKKSEAGRKGDPKKADTKKTDARKDDEESRGTLSDQPSTGSMAKGPIKTDAGRTIKVEKGQTLIGIARKLEVDRQTLIDANKLKAPYAVRIGQTLKLPGKRYYQVQSGDTLYSVARRVGVPAAELASFNDFEMSRAIRAGQKIYLPADAEDRAKKTPDKPAREAAKPVAKEPPKPKPATPPPARVAPPAPGPATAGPDLSAETGLPDRPSPPAVTPAPGAVAPPVVTPPVQAPAPAPARQPPANVRRPAPAPITPQPAPGAGFEMTREPVQQPAPRPVEEAVPRTDGPRPYQELGRRRMPTGGGGRPTALPPSIAAVAPSSRNPIIQTGPAPTAVDVASAGRGRFIWPLRGEIITTFGPRTGGQRSDGVNIAAREGDPVRAAADGEVVYAGDQVPSFGNLVLVKHPGGWVTAYAHLGRTTVKNRDQVTQGQQLGVAGATGAVTSPQLHFEIRYAPTVKDKAAPIDPLLVLPGR